MERALLFIAKLLSCCKPVIMHNSEHICLVTGAGTIATGAIEAIDIDQVTAMLQLSRNNVRFRTITRYCCSFPYRHDKVNGDEYQPLK